MATSEKETEVKAPVKRVTATKKVEAPKPEADAVQTEAEPEVKPEAEVVVQPEQEKPAEVVQPEPEKPEELVNTDAEVVQIESIQPAEVVNTDPEVVQPEPLKPAVNPLEITITNNGPRTFEVFTKTELPASETVVIQCRDLRQRKAVVSKFQQLNALAKKQRYIIGEV